MILVTVGMSTFKMDRLFKIIDELCDDGILNGDEIVIQTGFSPYKSNNCKIKDFFSYDEHHKIMDESDFIISHAGVGSVLSAIKNDKKVIVFPRLSEYGEHVDNHQLEICDYLIEKNYVLVAKNKKELIDAIKDINIHKFNKYSSNNEEINDFLIDYINKN